MLKDSSGRMAYVFYQLMWQSLDWLFPPHCGGCGCLGERWCKACQASTKLIGSEVCAVCGEPNPGGDLCLECIQQPPVYNHLRSWAVFEGPVREAIHKLKYNGDIGLGEILARQLIKLVKELGWYYDMVVPVPLSTERLKERGYNQSALLARPIALAFGSRYMPNSLVRVRNTASQVGLNAGERLVNVAGAFRAAPETVKQKTILVVDDVTTTGATIQACSEALLQAGASKVLGLTLARAI